MASDTATGSLAFAVYMAVVCYIGAGVCKWALLWVVAAVVTALTP